MKKYILSLLVTIPCMLQSGFGGFAANTASDNYMSTLDASRRALPQAASTTSTSTSTSTTQCPTQNTAGYYLQPFQVQLTNENNTILHTHTVQVPASSFALNNVMLLVHIYPPSNNITQTVLYPGSDNSYLVSYTLKDPSGSVVYKEFSSGLQLTGIPHQITISIPASTSSASSTSSSTDTTSNQAATFTPIGGTQNIVAQSTFLPALKNSPLKLTKTQRQQIINGISPICQKFLFTLNSSSYICIPISGTFDADESSQTLALATNPVNSTTQTTSTTQINALSIGFNDNNSTTITFDASSSGFPFNIQDLAKGLILNVIVYPSQAQSTYEYVAILRSSDGFKFHKKFGIPSTSSSSNALSPMSSIPSVLTISYNQTPILTTSFLSSYVASAQTAFNIVGPINLRFSIRSTTSSNLVDVIML